MATEKTGMGQKTWFYWDNIDMISKWMGLDIETEYEASYLSGENVSAGIQCGYLSDRQIKKVKRAILNEDSFYVMLTNTNKVQVWVG